MKNWNSRDANRKMQWIPSAILHHKKKMKKLRGTKHCNTLTRALGVKVDEQTFQLEQIDTLLKISTDYATISFRFRIPFKPTTDCHLVDPVLATNCPSEYQKTMIREQASDGLYLGANSANSLINVTFLHLFRKSTITLGGIDGRGFIKAPLLFLFNRLFYENLASLAF